MPNRQRRSLLFPIAPSEVVGVITEGDSSTAVIVSAKRLAMMDTRSGRLVTLDLSSAFAALRCPSVPPSCLRLRVRRV